MNVERTKIKLASLSRQEINLLQRLVDEELETRPKFYSNTKNTPREQAEF